MRTISLVAVMISLIMISPASRAGPEQKAMTSQAPVFLNHFFVVLDSATYKALEEDAFLRNEFAVTEKRTTVRTDTKYTGLYFYGTNTYFEFFDAATGAMGGFGGAGMAFGVDHTGFADRLKADPAAGFRVGTAPITRGFNDRQVPWFYMMVPKDFPRGSGLNFWLMEYHPRFLAEWNAEAADGSQGVGRKEVLARYKKVLGRADAKTYFKDVSAIVIALDDAATKKLSDLCQSLGYRMSTVGDSTLLEGPDWALRIVPAAHGLRGIQSITMQVNGKPPGKGEFKFGGNCFLRFIDDKQAVWSFSQ